MNILGVGIPELLVIFVVALIVLGPGNMVKTARQMSTGIKKLLSSDLWRSMVSSTKEIRNIQDQLIKETGLPESIKSLRQSTRVLTNPAANQWTNTIATNKIDTQKTEGQSSSNPQTDLNVSDPVVTTQPPTNE